MSHRQSSRLTPVSAALFRLALVGCPSAFRTEYGDDLLATLAAREAELRPRGAWALTRFRLRETAAILRAAWTVRRRPGPRTHHTDPPAELQMHIGQSSWTSGLGGDLRLAVRTLRRHPSHTAVAVLTLAVAVGAATAVFSVLNVVVLRPLPFPASDRLVLIRDSSPPRFPSFSVSPGRFVEWQRRTRAFDGIAATTGGFVSLTGAGDPERLSVAYASASLFDVLGVQPALGRGFTDDEDRQGGPLAIVLSAGLWQSRFGGRPAILGQTITIDDRTATVVGVMPETFAYPDARVHAWMPLRLSDEDRRRYGSHYLRVVGRMRPESSLDDARADMVRAARELELEIPVGNESWTALVDSLHGYSIRQVRGGLLLLVAAAGGVLLIACANVAGLLLARGADRQREIAVRSALGAGRLRLIRQLLVESAALGISGGALGVLVAALTLRALLSASWATLPQVRDLPLDGTALAFAVALALLTPIVFGLLPALQISRAVASGSLAAGGRAGSTSMRAATRSVLIVGEVALAVMLVTGSALLGRSLQRLVDVDPGFRPDQVIAVSVSLPPPRYPAFEDRSRFFTSLVEGARALPGVEHAALSQSIPFLGDYVASISLEGVEYGPGEQPSSNFYAVSSGYFSTMGIPVIRGRDFTDGDRADGPRVAIVSQGFASRIFPGRDALGQRFRISQGPREDFAEVVGIVGDVRHYGLDQDVTLQVYEPARQHPYFSGSQLLLRSALPAEATSLAVRRLVLGLDSRLPIGEVTLLEDAVTASTGSRRFTTALLSGLAAIALLLAAVGIYGLVSFSVGRRVQEFGIRIALGAEHSSIMRLVLGQGMRLALGGVAIGLTAGWFASRWLDSLLFEISARDPLAFVLAPAVLAAAVILACWSPARRALRVNPVTALRH